MAGKIHYLEIIKGVYWIEVKALDLRILCSCPADIVKHMMLKGLIHVRQDETLHFETGPNAILLSDVMLQNGQFSNMAEFPVLQMLYKQGMMLPDHPNNTGYKPLLIGSRAQIKAQMEYIYYGNYGLDSYEQILECVDDPKLARELWRMKKKFAFGHIKHTEELLDSLIIENHQVTIKDKLQLRRLRTNVFEFRYEDESVTIDINLPEGCNYPAPYPLGFHNIKREYFSIIHSGQGDGFDVNRPSMSSIISFQGKIFIVDAGPNISYSLTTLGIGISEIEGIFQTHAHDDHFAGITTLLRSDHRIKFYATPLVRKSVFKKLAVLLSKKDEDFSHFFDVQELKSDQWNDVHGLEVKPVISPHPVETTVFFFRTFWGGGYSSYAHLADISSLDILQNMIVDDDEAIGISRATYERVKQEYLTPVDLKKIDIGGGLIHGNAEDFRNDKSQRIILAHTAQPLTAEQKAIGSSAPFGVVDLMIPEFTNNLHRKAHYFLKNYFSQSSVAQIEKILNNEVITYPPGSLIIKNNEHNSHVYLVLSGYVEKFNHQQNYNLLSSGSFIGEYSGLREIESDATYRSVSYVQTLQIPAKSYLEFVKKNRQFTKIEKRREYQAFLEQNWLFKEFIGAATASMLSENMQLEHFYHDNDCLSPLESRQIYIIKNGELEIQYDNGQSHVLRENKFFNYESLINEKNRIRSIRILTPTSIFLIPHDILANIPIVLWKLLETYNKQQIHC